MVTFIPPYLGEEIKSNAERKVFEILRDLDLKNACVLHSLGLPRHREKIYGEIDFVVVCERGVACLEIKGGRVECREGRWFFKDRYGIEREKSEGPFEQVTGNMFSLWDSLTEHFRKNPHMKNLLLACGVVFPDILFHSSSEEIIQEIVYDASVTDITAYMNGVFDYWQKRREKTVRKLSPSDVKEITDFLRGNFCFLESLGARLKTVEKHLVRLTSEQVQVMDALSANEHLLIEGNAGTGKTLLAVDFAGKQAAAGKKVLYLMYNKNLAMNVKKQLPESENLKIINLHALFGEYVRVDAKELEENPQLYFSKILPEKFYDFLQEKTEEELFQMQYDLLVLDEGQDILNPVYLYSFDLLLRGGLENGRWAVFYDEKQNIYHSDFEEGMEILNSYQCTKFQLFMNCRNTIQIGTYSYKISGMTSGGFIKENGEEVQKVSCAGPQELKKKIKEILKHLRQEQVQMGEIVFLSPKRYPNSMLFGAGIQVNELGDDFKEREDVPVFATIQGFKGLDAKVVILMDVDSIRPENFSSYLYIAGTRARTLLYVVGSELFWEEHDFV